MRKTAFTNNSWCKLENVEQGIDWTYSRASVFDVCVEKMLISFVR